ncbi:hypothetical protein EV359DRAFT_86256 [Lentinula novae-zelandiae]|nr:hypothetical protein EV359DRAFT_86256 [Lentinula novae-zelandiae]
MASGRDLRPSTQYGPSHGRRSEYTSLRPASHSEHEGFVSGHTSTHPVTPYPSQHDGHLHQNIEPYTRYHSPVQTVQNHESHHIGSPPPENEPRPPLSSVRRFGDEGTPRISSPHPFNPSNSSTPLFNQNHMHASREHGVSLKLPPSGELMDDSSFPHSDADISFEIVSLAGNSRTKDNSAFSLDDKDTLRRFADKLGTKNMLKVEQYNMDGNIGHVKSSITIHGAVLQVANLLELQHMDNKGINELVANANQAAKGNVVVPGGVKKMIQALSKDQIINPALTSYTTLTLHLMAMVKTSAEKYDCQDILTKPLGGKAICTVCNDAAKSALQQLRTALIHSLWGEPASGKRKKGKEYQMRFAMMHMWLFDLGRETALASSDLEDSNVYVDEDRDNDENESNMGSLQADHQELPAKKPRIIEKKGKTSQRKAFWYLFTDEMAKRTAMWGTDLRKDKWKRYLADCVRKDWGMFGKGQQGLLAPLNLEPVPVLAPSSAPVALQSTAEDHLGDDDP